MHEILQATCGLVLLGTPHFGSDVAKLGICVANILKAYKQTNVAVLRSLLPRNSGLRELSKDFHALLTKLRKSPIPRDLAISCFYEAKPLPGIETVSVCDDGAIAADHLRSASLRPLPKNQRCLCSTTLRLSAFTPITFR